MNKTERLYTIVRDGYESKFYTYNGAKQQKRWYNRWKGSKLEINVYKVELQETQDFDEFMVYPKRQGIYIVYHQSPDFVFEENIVAASETQALQRARSILAKMGKDSTVMLNIEKINTCIL